MLRQAQHERIWGIHDLVPHPDTPPGKIGQVGAQLLGHDSESLMVEFSVLGFSSLKLPAEAARVQTDGLWKTTCFEVFLRSGKSEKYFELNFSPSFAWAAYSFERYREGMQSAAVRLAPEIATSDPVDRRTLLERMLRRGPQPDYALLRRLDYFHLYAEFDVQPPPPRSEPLSIALSAVIEETDGTKSYWALRHPPGKPDFHHPDCFALQLPALGAP